MAKKELIEQILEQLSDDQENDKAMTKVAETIVEQSEEQMATFVEGTKRIVKATNANSAYLSQNTNSINKLSDKVFIQNEQLKRGLSAVEKAIKGIKSPTIETYGLERSLTMIEKNTKESNLDKYTKPKNSLAVRITNGKEFINDISTANGGPSNLWIGGGGGRTPTVRSTSGVESVPVVNPDGSNISGSSSGDGLTDAELRASPVVVDLGANNDITLTGGGGATIKDETIYGDDVTSGILATALRIYNPAGSPGYDRLRGDATNGAYVQIKKGLVSDTPTQSSVAGSASSVTILSSNTSRKGATVFNDSSAILYLKLGTTASTTSYTIKMYQDDYFEVPFGYTGRIDGIWASATGNARITELT